MKQPQINASSKKSVVHHAKQPQKSLALSPKIGSDSFSFFRAGLWAGDGRDKDTSKKADRSGTVRPKCRNAGLDATLQRMGRDLHNERVGVQHLRVHACMHSSPSHLVRIYLCIPRGCDGCCCRDAGDRLSLFVCWVRLLILLRAHTTLSVLCVAAAEVRCSLYIARPRRTILLYGSIVCPLYNITHPKEEAQLQGQSRQKRIPSNYSISHLFLRWGAASPLPRHGVDRREETRNATKIVEVSFLLGSGWVFADAAQCAGVHCAPRRVSN